MKSISIWLIHVYRLVAPKRVRQACRYEPTCSEYAIQALNKYGLIKGWKLTLQRLGQCRPPLGGEDKP
ncbi:MAG: membrane protein insertion efficiency factor YidD [Bdellovibrionaceae bacterium]|nr:membrane protein insertion efficiency factor YidD [Pseudobdellovibrionaceae bacterium]